MLNLPRNYHDAKSALRASQAGRMRRDLDLSIRADGLAQDGDTPISILLDGVPLVTFFADGRFKVGTNGRNDQDTLRRINLFLPRGYRCRRKQVRDIGGWDRHRMTPHVYLLGPGRGFDNPIASFLSSCIFRPDNHAPQSEPYGEPEESARATIVIAGGVA